MADAYQRKTPVLTCLRPQHRADGTSSYHEEFLPFLVIGQGKDDCGECVGAFATLPEAQRCVINAKRRDMTAHFTIYEEVSGWRDTLAQAATSLEIEDEMSR